MSSGLGRSPNNSGTDHRRKRRHTVNGGHTGKYPPQVGGFHKKGFSLDKAHKRGPRTLEEIQTGGDRIRFAY